MISVTYPSLIAQTLRKQTKICTFADFMKYFAQIMKKIAHPQYLEFLVSYG
jgi:hypothetical protein